MRRTLAGPSSSTDKAPPKMTDPGKNAPAGSGGDYRRIATATGPAATKGTYTSTLDPGKDLPSAPGGSPAAFYSSSAGAGEQQQDQVQED